MLDQGHVVIAQNEGTLINRMQKKKKIEKYRNVADEEYFHSRDTSGVIEINFFANNNNIF